MTFNGITGLFREKGIDNPEFDAGILLCEFEGVPEHELIFRKNEDFTSPALLSAVERRAEREPLQYILGYWYFHGLRFELNGDCLCPREDTELLVDTAAAVVPQRAACIDIGTGSGAIAVALLKMRPDLTCLCCDISEGALSMARRNAAANGVEDRCRFEICDALNTSELRALGRFGAVLSNPPYIKTGVIAGLAPELAREPHRALDGGMDGMMFYRSILDADISDMGGMYLFEIGYDEAADIRTLAGKHGMDCEIKRDLGGNDRVAVLRGK